MTEKEQSVDKGVSRRSFARLLAVGGPAVLLSHTNFALPSKTVIFETRGDPLSRGKQQGEAFRQMFHPWMKRLLDERT